MEQAFLNAQETHLTASRDSGKDPGQRQEWKARLTCKRASRRKGFLEIEQSIQFMSHELYTDCCYHLLLSLPKWSFKTSINLDYEAMLSVGVETRGK